MKTNAETSNGRACFLGAKMADIDASLASDLDGATGYTAYRADYPAATASNQCCRIVYNADDCRGGIVFVGSGSSGHTSWTDAKSADDVLARFLADEMTA